MYKEVNWSALKGLQQANNMNATTTIFGTLWQIAFQTSLTKIISVQSLWPFPQDAKFTKIPPIEMDKEQWSVLEICVDHPSSSYSWNWFLPKEGEVQVENNSPSKMFE